MYHIGGTSKILYRENSTKYLWLHSAVSGDDSEPFRIFPASTMNRKRERRGDGNSTNGARLEDLIHPDFEELARRFPKFGEAWRNTEQARKNSRNPKLSLHITQDFSLNLTKALLHVYFGVSLTNCPDQQHLCPPVPNRYFYVVWIRDQLLPILQNVEFYNGLQTTRTTTETSLEPMTVGLDIGTGAFAIYPLLYCSSLSTHPCKMYATDVDEIAIQYARANVQSNPRISNQIQIIHVSKSDRQQQQQQQDHQTAQNNGHMEEDVTSDTTTPYSYPIGPLRRSMEAITATDSQSMIQFCMTNPPFYDTHEIPPRADQRPRTHMTLSEGCYPGGEVGFVLDMILDSFVMYQQHAASGHMVSSIPPPDWSSCMCGKKSSFVYLKHILEQLLGGPGHVQSTEFGPGQMTRWFLAWTFRQPNARSPVTQSPSWSFDVENAADSAEVIHRIQEYAKSFPKQHTLVCEMEDDEEEGTTNLYIREACVTPPPWPGDEALPEQLQIMIQRLDPALRNEFLPPEGHFLLILHVRFVGSRQQLQLPRITISVDSYQHSSLGKHMIEKIKSQLASDVCRTSRRWRRKLQRADPTTQVMDLS